MQVAPWQDESMAGVPFVDLARQHATIRGELDAAIERVVDATAFVLGSEVEGFEQEFAAYCGTRACVGVASGTAALTIALMAAGIGRGDEVVVPAHTFVASALAVVHAGATPVLCDVQGPTGLIDVDAAAGALSERTAAIMPVHLYGQPCDMARIGALATRHGLAVIEDAAQAHGASLDGRRVGTFGHCAGFSFYPSKNLGAFGDAGAICTDDPELERRARLLRGLGKGPRGEHVLPGLNERLDGVQAAVLRVKLRYLDGWNGVRRRWAAAYRSVLPDGMVPLPERERARSVYHIFPVRVRDRDLVAGRLRALGVDSRVHYSPAVHRQPALEEARVAGPCDVAEAWADEELSLPMFDQLTWEEVERVGEACRQALAPGDAPQQDWG